jgi:hypothetical protein
MVEHETSLFPGSFILNKSCSHIKTANCIKFYIKIESYIKFYIRHFTASHIGTAISSFYGIYHSKQFWINALGRYHSWRYKAQLLSTYCLKYTIKLAGLNNKQAKITQSLRSNFWYSFLPPRWKVRRLGISGSSN